ncbi:MAG: hypothetical protein ACRYFS_19825 [Janthinobacterium lividum]
MKKINTPRIKATLFFASAIFTIIFGFGTSIAAQAQTATDWTFSLFPSNGQIEGDASTVIGWGYSITNNNTSLWLLPFSLATDAAFQDATVTANPFDYPALAPGETVTTPYNGVVGLADLTWDADAPTGFVDAGNFTLTSYYFDGDPSIDGQYVGDAGTQQATYQATVTGMAAVPESSTLASFGVLLFLGGAGLVVQRRMRRTA